MFMRSLFLKDDQAALLSIKDKILYSLIVLFFITFYAPHIPAINNIVVGIIALYSFFYNSFSEKFDLLRKRKEIVLMVLLFLQHIISALLSKNQQEGFSWVTLRLPLVTFPIIIGLLYIKKALKDRILYAYAVITAMVVIICMVTSFIQYFSTGDASLVYNDNFTQIIEKQSVYIALLGNLAIFSFGYLLATNSPLIDKKSIVYTCLLFLLVANFLLASRIGIITLYSSIFCFAVWYAIKKKRFIPVIAVVLGVGVIWLLLFNLFPKTLNRFRELAFTNYEFSHQGQESHFNNTVTEDQWNGANIRLAVWDCGWELVKQHPVLGVQLGDKVDRLMEIYAARKFDFAYSSRRNLHNTYLDVLVAFGIVGLLLFLFGCLLVPLVQCFHSRDFLGVLAIVTFMLAFISETYFDRSMGAMIFGFFISFIVSYRPPVIKKAIDR
jgi:O-antigen ligase